MKIIAEILREVMCFIWYVLANIIGVIVQVPNTKNTKSKQPIVFVSGIGSQPLAFIFLKRFLEKRNFAIYFFRINLFKTLGIGVKDISQVAQEIDSYVKKNNVEDVVLVAMSAGAVASLLYLEKYNGWSKVKRYIALSPAFKGGWISYLFPFIPLFNEFKQEGKLVKMISQLRVEHPERAVSLYGMWDEFVLPSSSQLPGIRSIQLAEGGHAYLQTFSQKTFTKIAELAS